MAAAIETYVDVTISVAAASATRFSFGTYMGVFEHEQTTARQNGPYVDMAEVNAAGFTSANTPEINFWATSVFAATNGVSSLLIGRKIASTGGALDRVWQFEDPATFVDETTDANSATAADWTIFPATESVGDYVAIGSEAPFASLTLTNTGGTQGVDGGSLAVAWEYWDGAAWTALTGVTDGTTGFTAVVGVQTVTFTQPANWATTELNSTGGQLYYVRCRITAGDYSTNPVYDNGYITGDTDYSDALDQIEAVHGADSWYGHTIGSRVSADIVDVAAWTESRTHIFPSQSGDAAYLAGTAGNVGLLLQASGYNRSFGPLYHATSSGAADGYADGAWASRGFGIDLDTKRSIWSYMTLAGITYDAITSAQAASVLAANGNIYGRNKGLSFTSEGKMAAGAPRFIDIQTTIDWTKIRIDEDIIELFVGADVVPYTNGGINIIAAKIKERLDKGVAIGHFSPDPDKAPTVTVPLLADISAADIQARQLTLEATAVFAGGIQQLTLTVNLTFT